MTHPEAHHPYLWRRNLLHRQIRNDRGSLLLEMVVAMIPNRSLGCYALMKPSFYDLSDVIKFQQQFRRYSQKRKNSKNDFPREVEKFPSRGSKKNYVRENLQHPRFCVMIFWLSKDFQYLIWDNSAGCMFLGCASMQQSPILLGRGTAYCFQMALFRS